MNLTDDQRRILDAINATRPVTEEEAKWAVVEGYAAHGEDGDLDLTQEGRQHVDTTTL